MKARAWPRLLAGLLLAGGCSAPSPPDVIVYVVDSLRADHLSPYGYGLDTSPRLGEFARDAVVYEAAYSTSSWTRPAVASLLSGRYPLAHGAVGRADAVSPEVALLPEPLAAAGYRTAAFVTNANLLPVWGFGRGFDVFRDVGSLSVTPRAGSVIEAVLEHLGEEPQRPFLLYVHTRDPHLPYAPPPPYDAMFPAAAPDEARARYDGEVAYGDARFGDLLDFLEEMGLYREALIVFTSDHGEELRDRSRLGHGLTLFQELVRVPLLVKYPGNASAGTRVSEPVSLVDVLPTVLAVTGAPAPAGLPGIDLRSATAHPERPLFLELDLQLERRRVLEGVVLGRHKLVEQVFPPGEPRLFDLAEDPSERTDLAARRPELRGRLHRLLRDFRSRERSGLQLLVVGPRRQEVSVAAGRLRTDGRFLPPVSVGIEADDRVEIAEEGRVLAFAFRLAAAPNPVGEEPLWLVDQDRLVVRVDPPEAPLRLESFEIDGRPAPVFLGGERREADERPLALGGGAPELAVDRMELLLPSSRRHSVFARPGLYLGVERDRDPGPPSG